MTDEDKEDLIIDYLSQMEDSACNIVALSKEKQTNATAVVYVDSDGNDATVTVYDFKFHTWKSGDFSSLFSFFPYCTPCPIWV